ncbi:MAG: SH3 domain-containing protein [Planctomycetaceae bacterium]
MRLFPWITACLLVASAAHAADFPYRAAIDGNEVYVRSGPGMSYYPTSRLNTGDEVTVHRHDPGGWYMIAPPPGSFSWIRAEYVRQTAANTGELTANNVVVRVGSEFGTERPVFQRRLNIGDTVEIIGEETLPGDGATVRMYKIKPPAGEWRWIKGQYAVPADGTEGGRPPGGGRLEVVDSGTRPAPRPGRPEDDLDTSRGVFRESNATPTANSSGAGLVQTLPGTDRLQEDRDRLNAIDHAFRDMVERDVSEWDLDSLEKEYRHFRETAAHPALRIQVDLRLEAVERYRAQRQAYDDFVRLTRETDRVDQELLSMRPATGTESDATQPPLSRSPAEPAPSGRHEVRSRPGFDGAGIVQRVAGSPPGRPSHVLLAPDGRLLAYLQAEPGIDLDRHVGREMGLHGERGFRAELGTDLLRVRALAPVRLKR